MSLRVLGIDPGLTRCGIGVIDVASNREAQLVHFGVLRSEANAEIEARLLTISRGIEDVLDTHAPHAVAVERVFAQHNLRTVMGTAQVSGIALAAAARRGLRVGHHTPSEVKAAITGYGSADKKQVATMVARVLRLESPPTPADAADALALALCHAWRIGSRVTPAGTAAETPAQRAWQDAERASRKRSAPRA
ncbi:crossover junction endodeoxyribonuclease RuvC [Paramicrobacterium agarici]|uniref:Crossover junction endodeoxyribonuclease RuvC n=1 Tax=Paramicrobacterium agarici TaxID=630514 RepID=A0A2A9DY90_9MICO|nr:crossover junction endodeoxyribonuclease RuvC [Microbacterium agarici]PFG31291.1 Holliday junction endonuclease RuvC [Microbacterium agarici]